jgi:hypothetical protein
MEYNHSTAAATPTTWSGREAAYCLRSQSETFRTCFAIALVNGNFAITKFTEQGAAEFCGITVYRLRDALGKVHNGHHKSKPTLADMLASASPSERAEAAARLGPAAVWDTMISPLLDQERASQPAE